MDLDINQYLGIFVEESREHLQTMNEALLELEKSPEDLGYINEIFRVAHTLKGMSGTMAFNNMAELTHEMENLLQAARNREIVLNSSVVDVLFECFDALDESIDIIVKKGEESKDKHDDLINKIFAILDKDKTVEDVRMEKLQDMGIDREIYKALEEAREMDKNIFKIKVVLDEDCMLKSARAFIVFKELEDKGDIIFSEPSIEDVEDEKFEESFEVVVTTDISKEVLKKTLSQLSDIKEIDISLFDIEGEGAKDLKDSEGTRDTTGASGVPKIRKTVRVDIERLDNLMNLVSELIIIKTRMDGIESESASKADVIETIEYLDRITTSLHDAVMKVRMVPIERVFNRFPRLVRDMSRDLNKDIRLEMSGEETEVDRTIIDEIGDPLIHLIRNSLDHGIEMPDERENKGKDRTGIIRLKAYPDGNNVVIEVEDDGKGIDANVVREKAIEEGLISPEDAEGLSAEESLMLLFTAGLSTSAEVSGVSGRGVGLDVVRTKIQSINGNIEVGTELDKGSKFIIRIPLTLAIIQALMIKLDEEIFAIPLSSVTEITTIEERLINDVQGQEVVIYRGNTIPIIRLGEILQVDGSSCIDRTIDEHIMVIVNKGDIKAGLMVDELLGQQEIVIKSLGNYLNNIKYISGATILGDGSISLIIDINSLI